MEKKNLSLLKSGIYFYLFLLIFEGALRKWLLPSLSGPIALIRDPLALLLIILALKKRLLVFNIYLASTVFVGVIALGTTLIVGHGNLGVSLYGARILLLQFPLIFIIGNVLNQKDVLKLGNALLWMAIPMTALMIAQFYSPQSAWVNRGIGGDTEGAGFSGALGYFRPPGTFSFILGLTQFYGIAACYIVYFWFNQHLTNRFVLILATLGLIAAIPYSISRTLLYQTVLTLLFMVFAALFKPKYVPKIIFGFAGTILLFVVLGSTGLLSTPLEAFTSRFEGATNIEGGVGGTIIDRYLGGMLNAILGYSDAPFFGYGLGIGTNAGGKILTGEMTTLIYAEDEWARLIGESGLLLGLMMIFIRLAFTLNLAFFSFKALKKGYIFPWILLSFCAILILNGQWGQITTLGFTVFTTGLLIASLKNQYESTDLDSIK